MTTTTVKTTNKDRYMAILDILNAAHADEELIGFVQKNIDALDAKADRAKAKAAEKKAAGDALREAVYNALPEDKSYMSVADLLVEFEDDEEITKGKIVNRLTQLKNAGMIVADVAKVPGVDGGKAKTITVYARV
jgi:hypothetical protein